MISRILLTLFILVNITIAAERAPNVIVILADDLGNLDVGFNGCRDIPTPNLDKLAAAGVILTDAHTSASVCAPSRAGLLTGCYQQRIGFECNSPVGEQGLAKGAYTYAKAMKNAGYQTMALGKWHLGSQPHMHPNQTGFDLFSGFIEGSRSYWPMIEKKPSKDHRLQRNDATVDEAEIGYLTDWLTDEAKRLIDKRESDKPFFMYLAYNAPHTPMHAREEDLKRFSHIENKRRRTYCAMVARMDHQIGELTKHLQSKGLLDNTLIFFASDNGGATNNGSNNGIYRGMKGSKWEGGHRVPCFVHWPAGKLAEGQRLNLLSSTLDFMSTSLDAAGKPELIQDKSLDGISLLPYLRDPESQPKRDKLFFRRSVAAAYRQGDWKLIRVDEANDRFRYLLFDLSKDLSEQNNLAEMSNDRIANMSEELKKWEEGLLEPAWREGQKWEKFQRLKHRMSVKGRKAERKYP